MSQCYYLEDSQQQDLRFESDTMPGSKSPKHPTGMKSFKAEPTSET
jgi:hypothetical protein